MVLKYRGKSYCTDIAQHTAFVSDGFGTLAVLLMQFRVSSFVGSAFPPHFARNGGFKAACSVMGLAAFLYLCLVKIRLDKVRARSASDRAAEERGDKAYEISDTLLQGVQAIAWSLQAARVHAEGNDPMKQLLDDSSRQSDALMEESRKRMMSLRRPRNGEDLPNALAVACQDLQNDRQSRYRVIVNGEMKELRPMLRDDVYKIGREALRNAFRHSDANEIEAEFFYAPSEMRVYFRDDGCGMHPLVFFEQNYRAPCGILEMRRMAHAAGVDLEIRSRPNSGTEVELRISALIAYEAQ